jgi:hypothetical protein
MGILNDLQGYAEDVNPDELDKKMASGMLPPEGLHHAILDGYRACTAHSGSHGYELTFKILGGSHKGTEVKETLWASDKEQGKNRMMIFAHRLGLFTKVTENGKSVYKPVEGKSDFVHCTGAEVIIDVKHEKWEKDGKSGTKAILTFEGLMPLDDKRAAKVERGAKPAAGSAAAVAGAASKATQKSFSDL